MLARETGDQTLLPALSQAWEHMLMRRMYVTGGIGSVPGLEGFGNDDELDPEYAYAETCAAIASLYWNWEMTQLTGEAKYSDLFEWQLYNAASVGMGLDGSSYFYNNPLACRGTILRQPWFAVPCCPSNLSRTLADLGKYIFSAEPGKLQIHQYISSELHNQTIPLDSGGTVLVNVGMDSGFPWDGHVRIKITSQPDQAIPFELKLRRPSWTDVMHLHLNGKLIGTGSRKIIGMDNPASGFDPRSAVFVPINHPWSSADEIEIDFEMPVRLRRALPSVKGHSGKAAVTRGPLVYCLESIDNPGVDIFTARLNPDSLVPVLDKSMLGGIIKLQGATKEGTALTFIPYFLWGNRGPSQMTVWVKA